MESKPNDSKTVTTHENPGLGLRRLAGVLISGLTSKDTSDFYGQIAKDYDHLFLGDYYVGKEIVERFLQAGDVAVDFACGTGLSMLSLPNKFKRVFGIDVNRGMLEQAKLKFQQYKDQLKTENIYLLQGDITSLPLQGQSVDAALCVGAIWHLQEGQEQTFATEAFRVLKPGGRIVITAQAEEGENESVLVKLWNLSPLRKKMQMGKFSASYISDLLSKQGFKTMIDVTHSTGFPWKVVIADKPSLN